MSREGGQLFRKPGQYPGARLYQDDAHCLRIDVAEVAGQGRVGELGNAPAISTPVGPAPTRTKVSRRWRSTGSDAASASSKPSSARRRIRVASLSDLRPGARASQPAWPK